MHEHPTAPVLPATAVRARKVWAGFAGVSAAIVASAAFLSFGTPAHADVNEAKLSLARSLTALSIGNASAARNNAMAAVKADSGWGLAHAVLARSYLALGEGVQAEAELDRAKAAGFDVSRAHQLYAHAWLLQGDSARAVTEAAKAQPKFGGYAARVRARALAAQGDLPGAQSALDAVIAAAPGDSAAWSDLGRVRYNAGDVAGAIGAASKAIAFDPANLEALTLRGELVRSQYGLVASLPWFEAALEKDAYYHPALIEYAATLGDAGRYGDMLDATRRAQASRPSSAQALYLQATLAARAGQYDLARSLMQRTNGTIDGLPGALLLQGTLAYQDGAYEQAIAKWRELVGRQPMNIVARRLLGAALLCSGDAQGALDVLQPVATRGDADSYTLTLVARAFERTGQRGWAGTFLDRAAFPGQSGSTPFGSDDTLGTLASFAQGSPDDPVRRVAYLRGLVDAGDTGQALAQAQSIARQSPGAPAAHLAVGDTLAAMGRWSDAAAAYRRAADIRFDEPTMLRTVDALDRAGQLPAAANVLALFLSQNPQNIAAQRMAAHWQIVSGEYDAAIEALEGLRERVGNRDAALLTELSTAYVLDGDDDTGLSYAKAAYRVAPLSPATTDAYGWALYQQGRNAAAAQLLEKAVAIAPTHGGLHWHLAQVYADLGRKDDAKAQIAAAVRDPGFGDRAAAAAVLKSLG